MAGVVGSYCGIRTGSETAALVEIVVGFAGITVRRISATTAAAVAVIARKVHRVAAPIAQRQAAPASG